MIRFVRMHSSCLNTYMIVRSVIKQTLRTRLHFVVDATKCTFAPRIASIKLRVHISVPVKRSKLGEKVNKKAPTS